MEGDRLVHAKLDNEGAEMKIQLTFEGGEKGCVLKLFKEAATLRKKWSGEKGEFTFGGEPIEKAFLNFPKEQELFPFVFAKEYWGIVLFMIEHALVAKKWPGRRDKEELEKIRDIILGSDAPHVYRLH